MFTLPNLLTASNLICGFFSLFLALAGHIDLACYLIYLAVIFDFFDGFLARKLKQANILGKQLDSLADMVTFGVVPGFLVCILLIISFSDPLMIDIEGKLAPQIQHKLAVFFFRFAHWELHASDLICFSGFIIPFFSLFRLAKFNVDTRQSDRFIGLPTPANTLFFTAFPLLMTHYYERGEQNEMLNFLLNPAVFIPIIVFMSYLLIAEIPLFALKFKHFKWRENEIRFIFLLLSLVSILLFSYWSLLIIVILYLFLSLVEHIKSRFI